MKMISRYKKTLAMSAAALGLLAGLSVESSMAYFTTYVAAGGSETVSLEAETELVEDVTDMTKHISLKNISTKGDCFVRVKVFYGGGISVTYTDVEGKGDWYDGGDGYWYYKQVVPIGGETTKLDVKIDTTGLIKPGTPDSEKVKYIKDKFNVIVIQECTPVRYRDDETPYAKWDTTYSDYTVVED